MCVDDSEHMEGLRKKVMKWNNDTIVNADRCDKSSRKFNFRVESNSEESSLFA